MGQFRKSGSPSFEDRLGYSFKNSALLREALIHSSARTRHRQAVDNERLEFLGDRVLGLAIAELLVEQFPHEQEGSLAKRFNLLVRTESCAAAARGLDLGTELMMDAGEANAGGRRKESILAGACEALLGAVFLDGGFDAAKAVVTRLWMPFVNRAPEPPVDAKTRLQEWAQRHKLPLPRYVLTKAGGPDHAPSFLAEVYVDGREAAHGEGSSKKAAEQAAAAAMLKREGIWSETGYE
jgi:ribonuclease-3